MNFTSLNFARSQFTLIDFTLIGQSWLDEGFFGVVLVIAALAILAWFLSWLLFPKSSGGPMSQSLSGLSGLDERMAAKLRTFGIHCDQDVIRLSPRGQQELESQLNLHHGEYAAWRKEILSRWRTTYLPTALRDMDDIYPDAELGGLYSKQPDEIDDLTNLDAVDRTTAARLHAAGIYTFEQLRLMTPEQRANFKRRFHLSDFDFELVPVHGVTASLLARRRRLSKPAAASQPRTRTDDNPKGSEASRSDAAPAATGGPHFHLAQTRRSNRRIAKKDPDIAAPVLRSPSDSTTAGEHRDPSEPSTSSTSPAASEPSAGGDTESTQIPKSKIDSELGRVYTAPPPHRDDLSQLEGISAGAASQLNDAGIYTLDQILSLSPAQQTNFIRRFDLSHAPFGKWRTARLDKSTLTVSSGENVVERAAEASVSPSGAEPQPTPEGIKTAKVETEMSMSDQFGPLYAAEPREKDDLSRLGISPAAEQRMNATGIYTFEQLNALDGRQQLELRREFELGAINFSEWQRCIHAWSRGVDTKFCEKRTHKIGWLHGVRLPEVAPGIFDGQQLVAYPEQVIFRGSDPAHWGTQVRSPTEGVTRALSASEIRSDINYVRIRRVDTRDSVVTPITKANIFASGPSDGNGWNGSCEIFFGGRHLGAFATDIPNEVETRYGLGGWGFGHRFAHNDQQECAWEGRLLPPTTFEISVGHIGSLSGTVVFRSHDPTIWNQRVREGADRMALPIDAVTHPISFVRLLRVDTGQAVILRSDAASLLRRGENPRLGWNGVNEHFSGGHHLGIYHREAPQEVEICFGEGGWGFGHPYGDNNRQAYGWAGHSIGETVFEISVLEQLPDYLRHELIG